MNIKKYILLITLLLIGLNATFAQNKPVEKEQKKTVGKEIKLGSKGSKEVLGSISGYSHNSKDYSGLGFNLYFGIKFYPAKNFYLGIHPNIGVYYSQSNHTIDFNLQPSLSTGYLFPLNKSLYFNLGANFLFDVDWRTSKTLNSFSPVLITGLKQDLGTLIINYSLNHGFTQYLHFGDSPHWYNFYSINFAIGLSFYF